jgi:uncharacterized protein
MTSVVLDTNVFVSATFWKGHPYQVVRMAAKRKIQNFIFLDILAEFNRVLMRDFDVDERHAAQAASTILLFSSLIEPKIRHDIVKDDPDDNIIVDCAVAAKAEYIVTQDKHLLKIKKFRDIRMLTQGDLLEYLF